MTIALVKMDATEKNGVVDNVVEFDNFSDAMVFAAEHNFLAVDLQGLSVAIGDAYEDGRFCREGVVVTPLPDESTLRQNQALEDLRACILELSELLFDGGTV